MYYIDKGIDVKFMKSSMEIYQVFSIPLWEEKLVDTSPHNVTISSSFPFRFCALKTLIQI
jgi:hypothetical protein